MTAPDNQGGQVSLSARLHSDNSPEDRTENVSGVLAEALHNC